MKVDAEELSDEEGAGGGRGVGAVGVYELCCVGGATTRAGARAVGTAVGSRVQYSSNNEKKASFSAGELSTACQGVDISNDGRRRTSEHRLSLFASPSSSLQHLAIVYTSTLLQLLDPSGLPRRFLHLFASVQPPTTTPRLD